METTPPPAPIPPPHVPPPQGMGCFAKGCLTLVVAVCLLGIIVAIGGYFILRNAVYTFTNTSSAPTTLSQPTASEIQTSEAKKQSLSDAIRNHRETTVEFTAADLNALIASDHDFSGLRNHARVEIANSLVTLQVSQRLSHSKWSTFRDRWFNGTVVFGFSYVDNELSLQVEGGEANGHKIPKTRLNLNTIRMLRRSFSNDDWGTGRESDIWLKNIKLAGVQNDRIVITTRGQ